jgi:hypothetical protein
MAFFPLFIGHAEVRVDTRPAAQPIRDYRRIGGVVDPKVGRRAH